MQKRVKDREIVVYNTDKCGKLSVDSPNNYVIGMTQHLEGMVKSNMDEYRAVEDKLNGIMNLWCQTMEANKRVRDSLLANNNKVPTLYGLRKDHKPYQQHGPPLRPVCGAMVSSNARLSYFISQILAPLVKDSVNDSLH